MNKISSGVGSSTMKQLCEKILSYKLSDINEISKQLKPHLKSPNTSPGDPIPPPGGVTDPSKKSPYPPFNTSAKKQKSTSIYTKPHLIEDVKKTLSQLNSILKPGSNLFKNQKEIFVYLSDKGLEKLTEMIKVENNEISKLSFLCLVNLLYKNEVLVNIYCEKYGFNPVGNVICINWLPKFFEEKIQLSLELLQNIQESSENYKQNTKYWKWPNNEKYTDSNVPDPQKYLLGFIHKDTDMGINNGNLRASNGFEKKNSNNTCYRCNTKFEDDLIKLLEDDGSNSNNNNDISNNNLRINENIEEKEFENRNKNIDNTSNNNNNNFIENKNYINTVQ